MRARERSTDRCANLRGRRHMQQLIDRRQRLRGVRGVERSANGRSHTLFRNYAAKQHELVNEQANVGRAELGAG
jgi:hypothetical protein